jgi:hypothetical protein
MAATENKERRKISRIFFVPPIPGTFAGVAVEVLDLNRLSVTVAHQDPVLAHPSGILKFEYDGRSIALPVEVKRSQVTPLRSVVTRKFFHRTVLLFERLAGAEKEALEGLIVSEIEKKKPRRKTPG